MGMVQEQSLIAAVQQCYRDNQSVPPDFYDLRGLVEATGDVDSLTGVLGKLTDLNLFPSRQNGQALQVKDLLARSWIIDLHRLQELRELVVFLILDSLKNYFSRLRDQSVDETTGARELRCLIVIDEAHNFLPKDHAQVLEKCLRELRGKGVGVWLLTQNPRDLEQEHYREPLKINYTTPGPLRVRLRRGYCRDVGLFSIFRCCFGAPARGTSTPRHSNDVMPRSSCTSRLMLYTRLANPILTAARASPIPRITVILIDFTWCPNTCSTRARILERRLFVCCCHGASSPFCQTR